MAFVLLYLAATLLYVTYTIELWRGSTVTLWRTEQSQKKNSWNFRLKCHFQIGNIVWWFLEIPVMIFKWNISNLNYIFTTPYKLDHFRTEHNTCWNSMNMRNFCDGNMKPLYLKPNRIVECKKKKTKCFSDVSDSLGVCSVIITSLYVLCLLFAQNYRAT